jgi:hypothetical protein
MRNTGFCIYVFRRWPEQDGTFRIIVASVTIDTVAQIDLLTHKTSKLKGRRR